MPNWPGPELPVAVSLAGPAGKHLESRADQVMGGRQVANGDVPEVCLESGLEFLVLNSPCDSSPSKSSQRVLMYQLCKPVC